MLPRINRILIPLIILIFLFATQSKTVGNIAGNNSYLPIISHNPSGWIGPFGGTVVTIAVDPSNPQTVYAGSYGSGVYRSFDGGATWNPASQNLTNLYVYSLAIDPRKNSNLYAGTYGSQIYKSEDGGNSWYWSGSGMQAQAIVYSISIDGFDPSIIYATTRGASEGPNGPWNGVVYRSTDYGLTWQPSLNNLENEDWAYSIIVNPNHHDQVFIATHEHGPYRSDDYGESWHPMQNGIQDDSGRSIVVGLASGFSQTFYYGVWHNDSVYKSVNAGGSWELSNNGIPAQRVYKITLDPQDGQNIFLSTFTSGILFSADGGASWDRAGLPEDYIYTLVLNPNDPNHMLTGTYGDGVYRSEDAGANWSRSSSGINNSMVTSVVPSPTEANTIYASVYGGGVFKSWNLGQTWAEINTGLPNLLVLDLVMDPAHPGLLYALTNQAGLFKNDLNTTNGWIYVGQGLPLTSTIQQAYPADYPLATLEMEEAITEQPTSTSSTLATHPPLLKMVFAPSNPQIVYLVTSGSGVYRSSNGGQNWQPTALNSTSINSLAVDLNDSNLLYAISSDPNASIYNGVLRISKDGGTSWYPPISSMNFYSLGATPLVPGILYAGTSNGIYKYDGSIWTQLGLSGLIVTAIRFDPAQPTLIYAGTNQGAYYSLDGGLNWRFADANLSGQTIDSISINPTLHSLVYFGTTTHGTYLLATQIH